MSCVLPVSVTADATDAVINGAITTKALTCASELDELDQVIASLCAPDVFNYDVSASNQVTYLRTVPVLTLESSGVAGYLNEVRSGYKFKYVCKHPALVCPSLTVSLSPPYSCAAGVPRCRGLHQEQRHGDGQGPQGQWLLQPLHWVLNHKPCSSPSPRAPCVNVFESGASP